ncbi:MAG: hypothetical protein KC591_15635, partial [Gemmatimonadetes bacterium]|nr:hypothetical protein [Gemmatimonadota bacterium]
MGTTTRRTSLLLALGAGLVGTLRGLTLPATTDAGFLLLGAGNALLRGTVDAYAVPPGGLHSPPLGAIVTAGFALFVDSPEAKILLAGAVLLGITAALVAAGIARRAGLVAALAAAAFVILPPTFAAAFTRRPDAALAAALVAA